MHEQKLKENGLGYIDPKQNRVITTHGFRSTFATGQQTKLITLVRCVSMFLLKNSQVKSKPPIYVEPILKKVKV